MEDTMSYSRTKNPLFSGASGGFFVAGFACILLSEWINPAAFARKLAWLTPHYTLLMLGFVICLAAGHIVKLDRRIAALERNDDSGRTRDH